MDTLKKEQSGGSKTHSSQIFLFIIATMIMYVG